MRLEGAGLARRALAVVSALGTRRALALRRTADGLAHGQAVCRAAHARPRKHPPRRPRVVRARVRRVVAGAEVSGRALGARARVNAGRGLHVDRVEPVRAVARPRVCRTLLVVRGVPRARLTRLVRPLGVAQVLPRAPCTRQALCLSGRRVAGVEGDGPVSAAVLRRKHNHPPCVIENTRTVNTRCELMHCGMERPALTLLLPAACSSATHCALPFGRRLDRRLDPTFVVDRRLDPTFEFQMSGWC